MCKYGNNQINDHLLFILFNKIKVKKAYRNFALNIKLNQLTFLPISTSIPL